MSRFVRVDLGVRLFFVLLLLVYIWFLIDFVCNIKKRKAPFLPSSHNDLQFLIDQGVFDKCSSLTDLGCGHGGVLRYLLKKTSIQDAYGIDRNPLLILRGKICNLRTSHPHPTLYCKDFTETHIQTDCIYIYLVPSQLESLEKRFYTSLPERSYIISNSFQFPHWAPSATFINEETGTSFYRYDTLAQNKLTK